MILYILLINLIYITLNVVVDSLQEHQFLPENFQEAQFVEEGGFKMELFLALDHELGVGAVAEDELTGFFS